jgi:hypothetical protein
MLTTEKTGMNTSRIFNSFLAICLLSVQLVLVPAANAAMVSTESVIHDEQRSAQEARIMGALQRAQAVTMLEKNGLSVEQVEVRLQRLSNTEVAQLADQADRIPAGEGVLGVILVVLLIFLILEILGITDISPKV